MASSSPRALASTSIHLASATIPVRVYSATKDPPSIDLHLLHREHAGKPCLSRLSQMYVCKADGHVVEPDERTKGFEVSPNRYVVFSSEELALLEAPPSPGIHVEEFVSLAKIDPLYFSKAFYLGPDAGSERSLRLLFEVMSRMGKAALARYAQRGKDRLVVIRPAGEGSAPRVILQQLLHAEEVRELDEEVDRAISATTVYREEVRLLSELVGLMSARGSFEPERYPDGAYARMMAQIKAKVAGKEVVAPKTVAGRVQYLEIADALKASLAERGGKAKKAAAR